MHRLMNHMEDIMSARVIVAIAGMEGALASVIGGMADCPVIAVPTSVGYGANFGGLSALLSMLNSCASGISVVNIDNGPEPMFPYRFTEKKNTVWIHRNTCRSITDITTPTAMNPINITTFTEE